MPHRNAVDETDLDLSTELASERTRMARLRTRMANERTFAAWLRTGLGGVGGGFALVKVAPDFRLGALTTVAGVSLMLVGILIQVGVARESRSWLVEHALVGLPLWTYRFVVPTLVLASVLLLVVALAQPTPPPT